MNNEGISRTSSLQETSTLRSVQPSQINLNDPSQKKPEETVNESQTPSTPPKESNFKLFKKSFTGIIKSSFTGKSEKSESKDNTAKELTKGARAAVIAGKALGFLSSIGICLSVCIPVLNIVSLGILHIVNAPKKGNTSEPSNTETSEKILNKSNEKIAEKEDSSTEETTHEPATKEKINAFINFLEDAPKKMKNFDNAIQNSRKIRKENNNTIKELQQKLEDPNTSNKEQIQEEINFLKSDNETYKKNELSFIDKKGEIKGNSTRLSEIISSNIENGHLENYKEFNKKSPEQFDKLILLLNNVNPQLANKLSSAIRPLFKEVTDKKGQIIQEAIEKYTELAKTSPKNFAKQIQQLANKDPQVTAELIFTLRELKDTDKIFKEFAKVLTPDTLAQLTINVNNKQIDFEYDKTTDKVKVGGSLLRGKNNATKLLTCFTEKYINPLLNKELKTSLKNIKKETALSILNIIGEFVIKSKDKNFILFKNICKQAKEHMELKPEIKDNPAAGNLLFLRTIGPMLADPNRSFNLKLTEEEVKHSKEFSIAIQLAANNKGEEKLKNKIDDIRNRITT